MKIYEVKFKYWNETMEEPEDFQWGTLSVSAAGLEEALRKLTAHVEENYYDEEDVRWDEELEEDVEVDPPVRRDVTKIEFTKVSLIAEADVE